MKKLALFIITALIAFPASSFAMNVSEVISKANHVSYYQGKDGKANVEMKITDKQGRERTRSFTILRKDIDDKNDKAQRMYVFFHKPSDVNKTVFLVWKNVEKDDNRWLYLPALDLVKRISASDKRTSFVGSNFFYEDVSGRDPSEDKHEITKETDTYYIIKSTPKNPDLVEFSYYKNWIHKSSFIPVKTIYYDKQGKEYRIYEAKKVEKVNKYPTVTESKMTDLKRNSSTTMYYSKVEYDINLPENIFFERYLRAPPMKYLK